MKHFRTAIGLKCNDGIVIAVEKPQLSKMLVEGSNRRVFGIDSHVGMAVTGYAADGRQIVNRAREEASNYSQSYGHKVVPSVLANRLGLYVHYFTTHGSLRPFGANALITAYDEDTKMPELYMVEPSGLCLRYFGCAAGKGTNAAKTELEKVIIKYGEAGVSCRDAVNELAKILHTIRDPSKDKPFELEMGWMCEETAMKHSFVPADLVAAADAAAKAAVTGGAGEEKSAEPTPMDV
jgi:20S proteasome subunit alpha 7